MVDYHFPSVPSLPRSLTPQYIGRSSAAAIHQSRRLGSVAHCTIGIHVTGLHVKVPGSQEASALQVTLLPGSLVLWHAALIVGTSMICVECWPYLFQGSELASAAYLIGYCQAAGLKQFSLVVQVCSTPVCGHQEDHHHAAA